jgi:hypothetical protein
LREIDPIVTSPSASLLRALVALAAASLPIALSVGACSTERGPDPAGPAEHTATVTEAVATPCTKDLQGLGAIGAGWFGIRTDGTVWLPDTVHNPIGASNEIVLSLGNDNAALADMDGEALHNCVLKNNGDIWCWGANQHGQLGNGVPSAEEIAPVKVAGLPMAAKQVAVGIDSSCALLIDGTVWCWGSNEYGQLGNGQQSLTDVLTPVQATALGSGNDVISIGYWHGCALKGGAVSCWGDDLYGEIGSGNVGDVPCGAGNTNNCVLTPTQVRTGVQKVSAGGFYTCTIQNDASLWCWGDNFWGQLGLGDTSGRAVPTEVTSLGHTIIDVDTAVHATCAIVTGGAVRCWGSQGSGRLGNGTVNENFCGMGGCQLSPVPVSGPLGLAGGNATLIRESEGSACVVRSDGHVWCWGGIPQGMGPSGGFLDGSAGSSTPKEIDFCGLPSLTQISPNFGVYTGGTQIALTGDEIHQGATVTFNNTAAAALTVQSSTSAQVTSPNYGFVDTVDVILTNPDGHKARLVKAYSFTAAPSVAQVSPGTGPTSGGQMITIMGSSFLPTTTVDFGGAAPTNLTYVDANTLTATTPPHAAGPVDVTVTNPGNLTGSLTMAYTYIAPISIASIDPTTGPADGGTAVTLHGDGFDFTTTVTFDGVASPSIVNQDAQTIIATAPMHAEGVVDVVATRGDNTSATLKSGFTYTPGGQGGAGNGSGGAAATGGAGGGTGGGNATQPGPGNGCYCEAASGPGRSLDPTWLAVGVGALVALRFGRRPGRG